ncbi:SAM-dependent DNA methyltransferase [Fulvivirga lutimaris]|nr:SAM-dependent DNA methyltransferase [Fulvivirga lutimaris]
MQKEIKYILNQFKEDEYKLNKFVVSLYLKSNSIQVKNNTLVKSLMLSDIELKQEIDNQLQFGLVEVIQAFELAIPSKEQTTNGAVYTPKYIKEFIVKRTFEKVKKRPESILAGDISCGCGAFLFTLAHKIHSETKKSYREIFKDNLFGLDISQSSIDRTKILLSLLAITEGEDIEEFSFNLYTANALDFDWISQVPMIKKNQGFDLIVGNPPYVRAKNLHEQTKSFLNNWSVTKSGNPDLYIPFFEIGKTFLQKDGILGYITVNSFFKSVNARALRMYFKDHNTDLTIIDFGHEKIFGGKSAYTCICFLSNKTSENISFARTSSNNLEEITENHYHKISYNTVDSHKGWILSSKEIVENINKIENCGSSLDNLFIIKNGIATLSNGIYIFRPTDQTKDYYIFNKNGIEHRIEKGICRDIIKPNILKNENEIEKVKEKIIYPYTNGITPFRLMEENYFRDNYPNAYAYLLDFKNELLKRDKGNGDYGAWYAFGRTQALTDKGYKLMFPYMAKEPHFVYTDNEDMLIYCGYAIFSESQEELLLLKKILQSRLFDYYIRHTSKPYSAGYFSYAKNYVKSFSICELNEDEQRFLTITTDKTEIDRFLETKYNVSLN